MDKIKILGVLVSSLAITVLAFNGGFDNNFETLDIVFGFIFLAISIVMLIILTYTKSKE